MAEQQERPSVRRRSSFGRALDRVRDALKRRRSSAAGVPTLQSTREEGGAAKELPAEQPRAELQEAGKQVEGTVTEPKVAVPHESTADSQLVPDDTLQDDADDNEEPLTTVFSGRKGINEEKAKALFERYGIKYQLPPVDSSSPNKARRVERPVRIRIHWTCHQCDRQFGPERVCSSCGHQRCSDCTRSPPKKVKAILDEAKQMQIAEERSAANKDQILTAISPNTLAAPGQPRIAADPPLELDADNSEAVDISRFAMGQRPRSGIKLVMRSKAPTMRRICHECQTPFSPRNGTECESCGHQRCESCPTRTVKTAYGEDEAPFEPTMVATVQRVYRKPRQRIRWQCDQCDTIFADSSRCRKCDHRRCEACVRSPYVMFFPFVSHVTTLTVPQSQTHTSRTRPSRPAVPQRQDRSMAAPTRSSP